MINSVIRLAEEAGKAIMEVYGREFSQVTFKEDHSPLTLADTAAHEILLKGLTQLDGHLPVLSEESKSEPFSVRRSWQDYWLVDPLDGTKEFIKKNGEFTVNVALIRQGAPILGVVHVPAKSITYFASQGQGAFKKEGAGAPQRIHVRPKEAVWKVVVSRSHKDDQVEAFLNSLGAYDSMSVGSSLKLCRIAEGAAHFYPRFWPSMEWDIAAGQCLVEEAGGSVLDLEGAPLVYTKPQLENPFFLASALREPWKGLGVHAKS